MIGNSHGRTFIVLVDNVLESLRKNREEHIKIVKEAKEGFQKKVVKRLEEMLEVAKSGQKPDLHVGLNSPLDRTKYYDNAIGVLELTKAAGEERVEMTSDEIEHFVRDKWDWKDQFLATNSVYAASAARAMSTDY